MNRLYLVISHDSSWDWEREDIVLASRSKEICERAVESLTKLTEPNDDYNREFYIRTTKLVNNFGEMVELIKEDYMEDEDDD